MQGGVSSGPRSQGRLEGRQRGYRPCSHAFFANPYPELLPVNAWPRSDFPREHTQTPCPSLAGGGPLPCFLKPQILQEP